MQLTSTYLITMSNHVLRLFTGKFTHINTRAFSVSVKCSLPFSEQGKALRLQLLKKIYAPFKTLERNSPEYIKVATSGTCWDEFYEPFGWNRFDKGATEDLKPLLEAIDAMRQKIPIEKFYNDVKSAFVHQNCGRDGNSLSLADSEAIRRDILFRLTDDDLVQRADRIDLPSPEAIFPAGPQHRRTDIFEVRNAILAHEYIMSQLKTTGTTIGDEAELHMHRIHKILMRDLPTMERVLVWGREQRSGHWRTCVMHAKGMHFTVYPVGSMDLQE